jgi:CheY-like chemotaxis protein
VDPIVSVVVGEACVPAWGSLRYVLEREGFDVVGYASSPAQLERVLSSADPAAVVLDAEMGAMPVLTARKKAPRARIVVVWPWGASPAIADAWVDPGHAQRDLADVVRRATRSLTLGPPMPTAIAPVVWISDETAGSHREAPRTSVATASSRGNGLRRTGLVAALVAAALVVVVAGAFALTKPNHPHASGTPRNRAPATSAASTRGAPGQAVGKQDRGCSVRASVGVGANQGVGRGTKAGRGADRAQGNRSGRCGTQNTHAKAGHPGRHVGTSPNTHESHRPESPGRSAGKGHRGPG